MVQTAVDDVVAKGIRAIVNEVEEEVTTSAATGLG